MGAKLYRPRTLDEAQSLFKACGGVYMAGGTVLLVDRRHGAAPNADLISLEAIPELTGIRETTTGLSIGALVTMDALEASETVRRRAYPLWQAAREVGGPQVRNRATLGGNLCSATPSADAAPPLLALDASLMIAGPGGGERRVPLRAFFTGFKKSALEPGEILTRIEIPAPEGALGRFYKVGRRSALAISCLTLAVVRSGNTWSVAVGAAAPTPVWCTETSAALSSENADRIDRACAALQREIAPIDDRWGTASYRRTVAERLLRRALRELEA